MIKINFIYAFRIQKILLKVCRDKSDISSDGYYRGLSKSKDENLELHLERQTDCCFVDNCFDVGLTAW